MDQTQLVIFRGAPGSGKSTAARFMKRLGQNEFEHFETDQFFIKNGQYCFDRSRLREAHAWCQATVDQALKRGSHVIVSNTFTKLWELTPYLDAAKKYDSKVTVFRCLGTWNSIHGVPSETVKRMRDTYEPYPGELIFPTGDYHANQD